MGIEVGLLINFGESVTIKRRILDTNQMFTESKSIRKDKTV